MKQYALCDISTTEIFDTEIEARERCAEWIDDARKTMKEAISCAEEDRLEQWRNDEEYWKSNDSIDVEIRLYSIDMEEYWDDPKRVCTSSCTDGVERLDTWYLTMEDLL